MSTAKPSPKYASKDGKTFTLVEPAQTPDPAQMEAVFREISKNCSLAGMNAEQALFVWTLGLEAYAAMIHRANSAPFN